MRFAGRIEGAGHSGTPAPKPGRPKTQHITRIALVLALASTAFAQVCTTSISGTVYAPNGTDPLPNILVFVPTGPLPVFSPGVDSVNGCSTSSNLVPSTVLASTTTDAHGKFTLTNPNLAGSQTLVVQAGKWRRQYPGINITSCQSNTAPTLAMPANQSQGDVPRIAISSGSADALECVFRKIGISDSEFTAPSGTGHLNLYKGSESPGITQDVNGVALTSESVLVGTQSTLNSYDLTLFACQGTPTNPAATSQTTPVPYTTNLANLVNYANLGGRVFTTHYSYVWLNKNGPFIGTAKWDPNQSLNVSSGIATINQSFTEGVTLAAWLQYIGATTTLGQIAINATKRDQDGVIAPTLDWLNLNDASAGNPVMQFTFDTPISATTTPTVVMSFVNNPTSFGLGDTADTITVTTTNTSTAAADASLNLTLTLPSGINPTALNGSGASTGWVCALSTLVCNRTSPLAAGAVDNIVLTLSVPLTAPLGNSTVSAALSGGGLSGTNQCGRVLYNEYHVETSSTGAAKFPAECTTAAMTPQEKFLEFSLYNLSNFVAPVTTDVIDIQQVPVITWATPAPISSGTALSSLQLDATASVPGTFTYTPAAGVIEPIGTNTLSVLFTPTDTTSYTTATATVQLQVLPIPTTTVLALCIQGSTTFPCPATAGTSPPVITPLSEYYGQTFNGTVTETALDGSTLDPTSLVTIYDTYNGIQTALCTITVVPGAQCPATVGPNLPVGTHMLMGVYAGDATHATSTSNIVTINVLPDLTAAVVLSSLNPAVVGQTVTFQATVTGNYATPGGTVTFMDGTAVIGTGTLNAAGVASFTTSGLGLGTHAITAFYGATLDFNAATSPVLAQVIQSPAPPLTTAVTLTSSQNPTPYKTSVTFTAVVNTPGAFVVVPVGIVTFLDGTTSLGTATLDATGTGTYQTSTLAVGTHSITASYAGLAASSSGPVKLPLPPAPKPNSRGVHAQATSGVLLSSGLAPSISAALSQVITKPLASQPSGFTITATPVPASVAAGQYAQISVQVQEFSGFQQPVALSCTGLPSETTCVFQSSTIPTGGGSTIMYVLPQGPHSCDTPSYPYYGSNRFPLAPLGVPVVAALGLFALPRRRRKLRNLLAVVLMAGAATLIGCGTCTDVGVVPGNYSFTLTGTATGGSSTATQTLPITIQVLIP